MTNKRTPPLELDDGLRHDAQLLYQRMLTALSCMRHRTNKEFYYSDDTSPLPVGAGECIYSDNAGSVYYHRQTDSAFVLLDSYAKNRASWQRKEAPVLCIPIKLWEYKIVQIDFCHSEETLNELGNEGWELTAVGNEVAYFKREL